MGGESGSDVAEIRRADIDDTGCAMGGYPSERHMAGSSVKLRQDCGLFDYLRCRQQGAFLPATFYLWCHRIACILPAGILATKELKIAVDASAPHLPRNNDAHHNLSRSNGILVWSLEVGARRG